MSRPVQQDYIVRQRFSNALPPPPGAPKLLEIKTGGLKQYCMPPYASRLARMQPLNIEADADLGMPIDLVGMPGVFDGDESSILAPLRPPQLHPADQELLRPLKSLGQTKKETDISFLRRTHYTAEGNLRTAAAPTTSVAAPKRRKLDASKEDPKAILRNVIKGFDIANPDDAYTGPDLPDRTRGAQPTLAETEAWKHPKHPTNASLRPLDFYPIIPDLDAITLDGGFMATRFLGSNPADANKDRNAGAGHATQRYEPRMEVAAMRVMEPDPESMEEYQRKLEKFEEDPEHGKHPGNLPLKWEVFLPETADVLSNVTRALDMDATPDYAIDDLYTSNAGGSGAGGDEETQSHFRFVRTRFYEQKSGGHVADFPYEVVAMVLNDGAESKQAKLEDDLGLGSDDDDDDDDGDGGAGSGKRRKLRKAAYFAPVASTAQLKPRRGKTDRFGRIENREDDQIDVLQVRVADEHGKDLDTRAALRRELDPKTASGDQGE